MLRTSIVLALLAFLGSAEALKAPLGKLGGSRIAPVAKAGGIAAMPALFAQAPVWAKDAALGTSPYGTGGEGTSDTLGINDPVLLYVLLGVSGIIFTAFLSNANTLPDEDFFDGYDNTR